MTLTFGDAHGLAGLALAIVYIRGRFAVFVGEPERMIYGYAAMALALFVLVFFMAVVRFVTWVLR